jgi:hypothetical protein
MSERVPITGELKEMVKQSERIIPLEGMAEYTQVRVNLAWLREKLDAIDAIHANLERENARLKAELDEAEHRGWTRGYDEGFAAADDWMADNRDAMAEHGWVKLPKDADNVPWNVGDRDEDGNTVIELRLTSSGWCVMTDGGWFCYLDRYRHYQPPTVEDVLREFAEGLGVPVADSYIAASAAKLRLAEGVDE